MNTKRIFRLMLVCILTCTLLATSVYAAGELDIQRIDYEDGSYALITSEVILSRSTTGGEKTYTYYTSAGVKCFSYTLNGTFTYNGSTSSADSAYASYKIFVQGWDLDSHSEYTSGNTAYGEAVFTGPNGEEREVSLSIRCSASGKIS